MGVEEVMKNNGMNIQCKSVSNYQRTWAANKYTQWVNRKGSYRHNATCLCNWAHMILYHYSSCSILQYILSPSSKFKSAPTHAPNSKADFYVHWMTPELLAYFLLFLGKYFCSFACLRQFVRLRLKLKSGKNWPQSIYRITLTLVIELWNCQL